MEEQATAFCLTQELNPYFIRCLIFLSKGYNKTYHHRIDGEEYSTSRNLSE